MGLVTKEEPLKETTLGDSCSELSIVLVDLLIYS